MDSNKIRRALADSIVMELWLKDLISLDEKEKIMQKNEISFVLE